MKEAIERLITDLENKTRMMNRDLNDKKLRKHRDFITGMASSNEYIISKLKAVIASET